MVQNRKRSRTKANKGSGNRASVGSGASFSQRQQAPPRDATSSAQQQQRGNTPTSTATIGAQPKPSHVPSQPPAQSVWGRARNDNILPSATKGGSQPKGQATAGQTPPSSAVSATSTATASGATSPATAADTHTPVKGFAAREIKEFLKKACQDATAGDAKRASKSYKSEDLSSKRTSGAWAAKPHQMASGQDFWVQLTKQVAAREQGGG